MMFQRIGAGILAVALICGLATPVLAQEGATISGSIKWEGKPYGNKTIKMSGTPYCHKSHEGKVKFQTVSCNKNGTLKYVFVYVKEGLPDKKWPVPDKPVVLEQKGCMYAPHVFGMMAGQPLEVRNSDNTNHNIHALPRKNREFNFSQPKQGMKKTVEFKKSEPRIKIKCDVHSWMNCWAFVMKHPFFAVTGDEGKFEIKGLPPGEYVIEAWQEKYGTQEQKIKVGENETKQVEFTYSRETNKKKKK